MAILKALKAQLEMPRDQRPLGSGWLSGSLALVAALAGLLLVLVRWYPETLSYPELAMLHEGGLTLVVLRGVLLAGYALALVSLILSRQKTLGWTALGVSVLASLMATHTPQGGPAISLYFGLDYFIVNVLVIGFLFIPLERMFPARGDQTVLRAEWQEDMFYYLVSSMLVQIFNFVTLTPANYVNASFALDDIRSYITDLPFWVQVAFIMLATDFVQYWVHRAFHTFPFLWNFHAIHHSTKKMDWLAGARMHFAEIMILRSFSALPMLTLGFRPEAIQGYLLVVYFYSSFIHSNIGWNFRGLERFFVTPRFHHWHHGSDRDAIDINYASHFPIYDWLFGTHHLPKDAWPEAYGVVGDTVPRGYWRQFLYPLAKRWRKGPGNVPGE
ncbi:sterol desaturase family protein [Jannaschia pohangensis]|uniref:Sterol desaturase/sphingolipid hydroxylase, fatty acid hydroxylase superfamily n=1 Tax=Jannaschia pohangensis TaxID=390807 RepID=A0A1I3NI62_9RHOB|nr:sterol desaturase family protein [Jannaschia pohangensis]SFJ08849.1 Sterol desaturase/sphingolipid hydroxylase, fatty acid hydroxylase superfamily [Jannaschia pohangensis]